MARRGDDDKRRTQPRQLRTDRNEILYGRNVVHEVLRGRRSVVRLLVQDNLTRRERVDDLVIAARSRGVAVSLVNSRALDDATHRGNHQGVAVEVGPYPYVELDDLLDGANGRTLLLLDRLQDPQNLATLIRTAAAADAAGVIIQTDRSAAVSSAVVHVSAGIVERVPVARVTNSGRAIATCRGAGYWAVALERNDESRDMFDTEIPSPTLLIVGSEGSGVSVPALKAADLVVHLPMPGGVESLNAAVAGSIALYELLSRAPEDDDLPQEPETLH